MKAGDWFIAASTGQVVEVLAVEGRRVRLSISGRVHLLEQDDFLHKFNPLPAADVSPRLEPGELAAEFEFYASLENPDSEEPS
jgi:hypothetical protein